MDGLPKIYKSSRYEFWPTLAGIEIYSMGPMIIAIYFGPGKPELNEFFAQFVSEMQYLMTNGITHDNIHYCVLVNSFVCDSPARAFIKGR